MAFMLRIIVLALSCVSLRASTMQEALLADTECQAEGSSDCSLSALQLRAREWGEGRGLTTTIRTNAHGHQSFWGRPGVGSPLSLAAKAFASGQSTNSVTLYTKYGMWVPYVPAEVGEYSSQSQWMGWICVDSGSPLFWVRSVDLPDCRTLSSLPSESSSARPLGRSDEFGYGSGVVTGPLYTDTLRLLVRHDEGLGPYFAVKETFQGLTMLAATAEAGMQCSDGILGMDMASETAPKIFQSRGLPQMFTIFLNPVPFTGEDVMEEAGTMTFGSVDPSLYSGGLLCVPMLPMDRRVNASRDDLNPQGVPVNNTAWWQLEILGVRVGSRTFGPAQGIVDTGTSDLIVTTPVMNYLDELFIGLDCGSMDSLPAIVFTLAGGHEISVGPQQYISQEGGGGCSSAVASLPDAPSPDFFVLGDPFFWKHLVAFDYAGKQVGLGLKTGVEGEPLPQTCASTFGQ